MRRFIELSASALGWEPCNGTAKGSRKWAAAPTPVRWWFGSIRAVPPSGSGNLLGDPTRAREKLGWTPTTTLEEMVNEMIDHDREEARKEAYLKREGFQVVGPRE